MNRDEFERWAPEALRGDALHDPTDETVERAIAAARQHQRQRPSGWSSAKIALLAAAVLVIAVLLALLWRGGGPSALPAPPEDTVRRGAFVTDLEPRGELGDPPVRFTWSVFEGAARYRVRVYGVDDTVRLERVVVGTEWQLDEEERAALFAGVRYAWRVEALDPDDRVLGSSEPVSLFVRP